MLENRIPLFLHFEQGKFVVRTVSGLAAILLLGNQPKTEEAKRIMTLKRPTS